MQVNETRLPGIRNTSRLRSRWMRRGCGKGLPPAKSGCTAFLWGLIVLCLCGAGCNRAGFLDDRDRNNRRVARAYELLEKGQYSKAGETLEQALETDPNLVRPHLDLGLLLHDQEQDYIRAIYHYRRYLDLRPTTEKREMVEDRIRQAALAFYKRVKQELEGRGEGDGSAGTGTAADAVDSGTSLQEQNASLTAQVEQAAREISALGEKNRMQRTQIEELQGQIDKLQSRKIAIEAEERAQVPDAATSDDAASDPPRTYTVRPNDSLSVIAHRVYGDATKWHLIQRANREVLGDSVALRIGQVLVIP